MGEVFKDPEARRELFEFAEIEGNENDIEYNMKLLFTENNVPHSRQKSAIVNAFYKNAENYRQIGEEEFNEQEFIDFINDNNIGVLAPYLYENFDPESITELTVSWWTEEMELEGMAQDPDWDGETPGFKLSLNDDGNFIQFRTSEPNFFENNLIYANDEYAYENPTVVFGNFYDDDMSLDPGDGAIGGGGGGSPNPQPSVRYPHEIGLNCTNVGNTDIINWSMKNFKITGNTRGWPHPNRISMWVLGTNATAAPFFDRKKISRGDFNWKTDFIPNGGVIVTGWELSNFNQNIIIGVKRPTNSIEQTVILYQTNSDGEGEISSTLTISRAMTFQVTNQSWLRCSELNGNYLVDRGNDFIGPVAIWAYDVGRKGFEVQFTVAPEVIRIN